ncbi:hypothetical protein LB545_29960 [Mesorhizobium sp. BR1-1-6]|uniref:hypothetical protein n=1 Tax=Mesorhizobium sp. BR1-1-6 TaxID=2876648 RepID=UPI001CD1015D|nr:hypothetical protein [Mesorhizobium sp. BR1-1-6]MBZ9898539.1 hypothetical protein [Mesorhizobium sp. BR1-1-6]
MADGFWYGGAFLFSLIVLGMFTWRRFGEIDIQDDGRLSVFLQGERKTSYIATKGQYRRGFLVYYFAYLIIFVALCLSQPIASWVTQQITGNALADSWATPAGPLFVCSLLVGIFPHFSSVETFENSWLRLSQKVAGVPEDLIELISFLSKQDILDKLDAVADISEKAKIKEMDVLARIIRLPEADRVSLYENSVHCALLTPWTVHREQSREIWSDDVIDRFRKQQLFTESEYKSTINLRDILLRDWKSHADALNKLFGSSGAGTTYEAILASPDLREEDSVRLIIDGYVNSQSSIPDISQRLLAISERVADCAYYHEALLALLISNDKNASLEKAPPSIASISKRVKYTSVSSELNRVALASVAGLFATFVVVAMIRILNSESRGDSVDLPELIRTSLAVGWYKVLGLVAVFVLPVFVAVLYRYRKRLDRSWKPLYSEGGEVRVLQMTSIAIWTFLIAAFLQGIVYLGYKSISIYFEDRSMFTLNVLLGQMYDFYFTKIFASQLLASILGCVLAVSLCYTLDRSWVIGNSGRFAFLFASFVVVSSILFFVAVQFPFAPTGYFAAKSVNNISVGYFDNLISDVAAIGTFLIFFFLAFYDDRREVVSGADSE